MTNWRPISTAPTAPGPIVDLWIVPGKRLWVAGRGKPYRIADAKLSDNGRYWLNDGGEVCVDMDYRGPDATIATHWMPVPEPPETT